MRSLAIGRPLRTPADHWPHPGTDEVWGLGRSFVKTPHQTRHFEMHDPDTITWLDFPKDLAALGMPVYMREKHPDVPNSIRYPIEKIEKEFRRYFTCSLSYMLALGIFEGFTHIKLIRILVAPTAREYALQKACLDYWCGVAEGRGIEVETSEASVLMRSFPWMPERYAYDGENERANLVMSQAIKQIMEDQQNGVPLRF